MKRLTFLFVSMILMGTGCIGDDILFDTLDPELRITNAPDVLALNDTYTFEAMYLNNVGVEEMVDLEWSSLNPDIISIDSDGMAEALSEGTTSIRVQYDDGTNIFQDDAIVEVGDMTVVTPVQRTGTINTTSSYVLTGDFTLSEEGNGVKLDIAANYQASTALPGLYVYLSNNPNSIASAYEIGAVQTFSGAHSYTIPNTGINDYNYVVYFCKPFNVKVGHGDID